MALNPQLLPGCSSIGCPLLWLCVHYCVCALGWVKCRAQIPSMGHHIWQHVFFKILNSIQDFKSIPHNLVFMLNWCLLWLRLFCFVLFRKSHWMINSSIEPIWLVFAVQLTDSGFQSKRLSSFNTTIQWSGMTGVTRVSEQERWYLSVCILIFWPWPHNPRNQILWSVFRDHRYT